MKPQLTESVAASGPHQGRDQNHLLAGKTSAQVEDKSCTPKEEQSCMCVCVCVFVCEGVCVCVFLCVCA